jgi:ABC-type transport system involved in cytochrome c biogenesis permease subunit
VPCVEVTLTMYTPEAHALKSNLCVPLSSFWIARSKTPLRSVTSILYSSVVLTLMVTSWLNGFGYAAISNAFGFTVKRTERISVYSFAPS